jgi:hypothetical protein
MQRFLFRGPVVKSLIAVVLAASVGLTVALVVASGGRSSAAPASVISPAVASVLSDQSISLSSAPGGVVPAVSGAEAVAANAQSASNVVAEQLVELTAPFTDNAPQLVWAIQESLPGSSGDVSSAIVGVNGSPLVAHGHYNYRVDLVDASTNQLVFATEGYAPELTSSSTGG